MTLSSRKSKKLAEGSYADGYVQCCQDLEVTCDDDKVGKSLEVYVTGLKRTSRSRSKGRGKGKGKTRKKGSGKGGSRSSSRRKAKSDSHFQKSYRKLRKGPRRSLSSTRGYTPQHAIGAIQYTPEKVPYDPAHLKETCKICLNRDDSGKTVKGHMAGAPLCPKVQTGSYPPHPRWAKTGWQPKGKVAASSASSTPGKFPTFAKRGPDGRFRPGKGKASGSRAKLVAVMLNASAEDQTLQEPQTDSQ